MNPLSQLLNLRRVRREVQNLVTGWSAWSSTDNVDGLRRAVEAAHKLEVTTGIPNEAQRASDYFVVTLTGWAGSPLCPGAKLLLESGGLEVGFDMESYPRPDVKQAFGLKDVPNCGFVIRAPVPIDNKSPLFDIQVLDALGTHHAVDVPHHQSLVSSTTNNSDAIPRAYVDSASLELLSPKRNQSPGWQAAALEPLGVITIAHLAGDPGVAVEWYRALQAVVVNHSSRTQAAKVALGLGFDEDALAIGLDGANPRASTRLRSIRRPSKGDIRVAGSSCDTATSVRVGYLKPQLDALVTVTSAHAHADGVVTADEALVTYEAAAETSSKFVAGHWDKVAGTGLRRNRALTVLPEEEACHLAEAVMLTSRCAGNYFHSLVEHVPRLLTIRAFPGLSSLPLLVDEATPESVREAIRLITPSAELIDVPKDMRVRVDRLHLPLLHSFVPDSTIYPFSAIRLSRRHLHFLRNELLPQSDATVFPKRLFLGRSHGTRNVLNGAQIRSELEFNGFTIVDTGRLSLRQQIALFNGATDIVGVAGAAFANTIFCSPKARITALYADHNRDYPLQRMLANAAGATFSAFHGTVDSEDFADPQSRLHAPFAIPIGLFREHLQSFHAPRVLD